MKIPSLAEATTAIQRLPNLEGTTRQLLDYLSDDRTDLKVIVRAIECDQGLAIRVLRVANSPFYGMPNKVQTINDAVMVLGYANLRMLIIAIMTASLKFPNLDNDPAVLLLFRHGLGVAICASIIARNQGQDVSKLFLAGILHDIGKLALMSTYPDLYREACRLAGAEKLFLFEAERKLFGFDHTDIGASLCRQWNLPESIVSAIAHHHQLADMPLSVADIDHQRLFAGIIHLADAMALGLNLDGNPHAMVPPVSDAVWMRLGGRQDDLARDFVEIHQLFNELSSLFVQ